MKEIPPEPGFVQAYQLFVVIRILFWVAVGPILILLALTGHPELTTQQAMTDELIRALTFPRVLPLLAMELVLLGLLMWPRAQARLGAYFVPVTLGLGLLPLLIGYYRWPAENPLQSPFVMFFFVTAVLVAWEYKYRHVALYVFWLAAYEALVSPWPANVPWTVPLGWLILQAVMMLLVGYVTATLVSVQREQRSALVQAYQRQAVANQRLQQYAATLEELAITRERNRLARELHDTLAHSLSAVTVQLEAVRSLWDGQPENARRMLDQADATARVGLSEARRALQALRASPLQELGLLGAVQDLAETAAGRAGARLELMLPAHLPGPLSPAVEQGVYRIIQETLDNTVSHAIARTIRVEFVQTAERLSVCVEDDGQGIDPEALRMDEAADRFGIRGMHERAHLIGGELEISGREAGGTRVLLSVLLESQDTDHDTSPYL
jgi:signal transduction histidine kinase